MPTNEEFKRMVLGFLEMHKMRDYAFGKKTINDSRLVHDLRKGREFGEEIKTKVISFMDEYNQSEISNEKSI